MNETDIRAKFKYHSPPPYCGRCSDTGLVLDSTDQTIQPVALACSCVLYNPVIKARRQAAR